MSWESIGDVGSGQMPHDRDWILFCYRLAISYLKFLYGDPPAGTKLGVMWNEHELGPYPSIGVYADDEPPWAYIRRCEAALERFDDAVSWTQIDPGTATEEEEGEDCEGVEDREGSEEEYEPPN